MLSILKFILLITLLLFFSCSPLIRPQGGAELNRIETPDGVRIALHRYMGTRAPVILCHGFTSNHLYFDIKEDLSLARFLNSDGFDVWMIDLRGAGSSKRPSDGWHFEDYIKYDLPSAIKHVAETTGKKTFWIGHSMGGMLMFACLSTGGCNEIRGFIVIGSPADFSDLNDILFLLLKQRNALRWMKWLPTGSMAKLFSHIAILLKDSRLSHLIFNPENMERDVVKYLMRNAVEDVPSELTKDFTRWTMQGVFTSRDGFSYLKNLKDVRIPALFITGMLDALATPYGVRAAYEAIGSQDKEFRVFSRANGDSTEYGHVDLVSGSTASKDVFPYILRWLEGHI